MTDVFNTTTGNWSTLVQTAYDTAVNMFLQDMPQFSALADKHPVAQAMPGQTIDLVIHGQLAPATTPLDEVTDVSAQALPAPRHVQVTVNEYGDAAVSTLRLEKVAYTGSVVKDQAFQLADQMVMSTDAVYQAVLDGATNKLYVSSTGTLSTSAPGTPGTITGKSAAAASTLLADRRAPSRDGQNYVGIIHPNASFDLRTETGMTAWLQPRAYVQPGPIYTGEIGQFQRTRWIENPRSTIVAGTPNLYNSYVLGREALLEATVFSPHTVIGPVTDRLRRFTTLGWYGFYGVARFRENCIQLIKTTSSLDGLNGAFDPKA